MQTGMLEAVVLLVRLVMVRLDGYGYGAIWLGPPSNGWLGLG